MTTTIGTRLLLRLVQTLTSKKPLFHPGLTHVIQGCHGNQMYTTSPLRSFTYTRVLAPLGRQQLTSSYHSARALWNKAPVFLVSSRCKSSKEAKWSKEAAGLPEILESDLEESFTHGSGPGGQSVNKTTNCCVLRHVPSGVQVKVHETRSLHENRELARLRLRQKLDWFYNGEGSKLEMEKRENSIRRKEKKKKTNERLEKLKAFKDREGLT